MSKMPDDSEMGRLLRQGLSQVPVRSPAADFDDRVRAGLRRDPEPSRWQLVWGMTRPVLLPAACSLVLTLALLKGIGTPRAVDPGPNPPTAGTIALDRAPDRMRSLDQALDRIDRDTPSLGGFGNARRADRAEREPQPRTHGGRGASGRRSNVGEKALG